MDQANLNVPLHVITKSLYTVAKTANTPVEKAAIYDIAQALGGGIKQVNSGFNETDFLKECGVSSTWAKQAA